MRLPIRGSLLLACLALSACAPAWPLAARLRHASCQPPDDRRDTYFRLDAPPSPDQLRGRYRLTWRADAGRGRGRSAVTTLWLAPHPQAPTHAVYGALVDTTAAQFAALEALGLHRARTLAVQSPTVPGFAAWLYADQVFRFHGLGGTMLGDGGFAELVVDEYRGPDAWRGRWRSTRPFSTDPTGGYVCAERLGD